MGRQHKKKQLSFDDMGWLKRHGLSVSMFALFLLFAVSFVLHAHGGAQVYTLEELEHGGKAVSTLGYMATSRFWFESLQNWQSEFFSVGAMMVLSIYLRERHSPQSKPVADPNSKTGG